MYPYKRKNPLATAAMKIVYHSNNHVNNDI